MELWFTEKWTPNIQFSIRIKEHLYSAQTPFQKIDVYDSYEVGRFFALDGYVMITEKDEFIYHEMIVHVPMNVNPNIKNVLVIGGGDGGTVRELCRYESIQSIDMIEIDEEVVKVCQKYFQQTASKLTDPRVSIKFEDGLLYVQETKKKYDLIIVDSTDPIGPGEGLFTQLFYDHCHELLTDDGILVNQHESPYFDHTKQEMRRAHHKIKKLFPITKVYQAFIPTYPSGHWLFGFASKKFDPIKDIKEDQYLKLRLETKYYNTAIHKGSFALPNYVINELKKV